MRGPPFCRPPSFLPRKAKLKSTDLIYTMISKVLLNKRLGLNLPRKLDDDYWIGILKNVIMQEDVDFFILNYFSFPCN
jgi:hypothetical protein